MSNKLASDVTPIAPPEQPAEVLPPPGQPGARQRHADAAAQEDGAAGTQ